MAVFLILFDINFTNANVHIPQWRSDVIMGIIQQLFRWRGFQWLQMARVPGRCSV